MMPALLHGPELHGIEEHAAVAGGADEDGDGEAVAGGEQTGLDAVRLFLRGVEWPEAVAEFGAGHLLLKFGAGEDGAEEAVLIEEDVFIEGHVGDADGAFVAEGGVVAVDGDFVDGVVGMGVEAAMAVVIADGVGGGLR